MLKSLFASEKRVKLVTIILLSPNKAYTARQLAKESGVPLASVRKEITNLQDLGLLRAETKDSWTAKKDFIIYPELRALIAKAQLLSSQKFIDNLKKNTDPKLLALTGFFTGDELVKTDILVVGKLKRRPFFKLLSELEKDVDREINYTIMDEAEFLYRREVMDIFLYNILMGKTIFLIDHLNTEENTKELESGFNEEEKIDLDNINENESLT